MLYSGTNGLFAQLDVAALASFQCAAPSEVDAVRALSDCQARNVNRAADACAALAMWAAWAASRTTIPVHAEKQAPFDVPRCVADASDKSTSDKGKPRGDCSTLASSSHPAITVVGDGALGRAVWRRLTAKEARGCGSCHNAPSGSRSVTLVSRTPKGPACVRGDASELIFQSRFQSGVLVLCVGDDVLSWITRCAVMKPVVAENNGDGCGGPGYARALVLSPSRVWTQVMLDRTLRTTQTLGIAGVGTARDGVELPTQPLRTLTVFVELWLRNRGLMAYEERNREAVVDLLGYFGNLLNDKTVEALVAYISSGQPATSENHAKYIQDAAISLDKAILERQNYQVDLA